MVAEAHSNMADRLMQSPRRRRRRFWPVLLTLVVFLAAAWIVYWYIAYQFANRWIVDLSTAENVSGVNLGCGERAIGGFPLQISVNCGNAISEASGLSRTSIARVAATAPLYDPGRVEAQVEGPFAYEGTNHSVNADWSAGSIALLAGLDGVSRVAFTFGSPDIRVTDDADASVWSASATDLSADIRPAAEENALRVSLTGEDLFVELGDSSYPTLTGTAMLTLFEAGQRLDRAPADTIGAWLEAGGQFRIDLMSLATGDVEAEVSGPLTLGVDGYLTGELTVRYAGEHDLPLLIAAVFPWLGDEAMTVAEGIRIMSRPIEMRGEPAHETTLTVRDGAISIGFVPLMVTIPSVGPLDHYL